MAKAFGWRLGLAALWALAWNFFWHTHLWVLYWRGQSFIENGMARQPIVNLHALTGMAQSAAVVAWVPHPMMWLPSVSTGVASILVSGGYLFGCVVFFLGWPPDRPLKS